MKMPLTSRTQTIQTGRRAPFRDARLFVVATEGSVTEPHYFTLFSKRDSEFFNPRVKRIDVLPSINGNSAPKHVLNNLKNYRDQHELAPDDQLWLVVDVDRWGSSLSSIVRQVQQCGFHSAISNPSFEVWLLCHHGPVTATTKLQIKEQVAQNCGNTKKPFDLLPYTLNVNDAIGHAKARCKVDDPTQIRRWPKIGGTHVYRLIEMLIPK
ncbi:MAG: RloB domain-containing protein [Ramlibacter sp.]|nr:RloB domain-containing protein [Ramlibacter sp.]